MVTILFTPNLLRHVAIEPQRTAPGSLREVLEAAFERHPRLRGYLLDDQGGLRRHLAIFVNGVAIHDRVHLRDPVPDGAEVYVMQSLSGG